MTPIQASKIIKEFTKDESKRLSNLLRDTALTYNYSQQRLDEINFLVKKITEKQAIIINQLITEAYSESFRATYKASGTVSPVIPNAAIGILAKDTIRDLNYAVEQSATTIGSIFKLAKQDIISETKISETVLDQLMRQGTFRESAKDLSIKLLDQGSTVNTRLRNLDPKEVNERVARARRKLKSDGNIPKYLKTKVFDRVEGKLLEGKFITIINKNKQPMTFSLDYYTGLVARTRFGDAQVQGTLDSGARLGVQLYLVSDHDTKTEYDKKFENKFLSADPLLIGKTFNGRQILELNDASKPLYHPNCKHRLIAYPITQSEYESIIGGKQIAA